MYLRANEKEEEDFKMAISLRCIDKTDHGIWAYGSVVLTSDICHLPASKVDAFSYSAISKELLTVLLPHVVTSSNPANQLTQNI